MVAGERPVQVTAAVPGSVVPHWQEGLAPTVLAPDYWRIMDVLAGGSAMDCRRLAAPLGLEPVPAKVEGVRSKAKRLAARGWLVEERPGLFTRIGYGRTSLTLGSSRVTDYLYDLVRHYEGAIPADPTYRPGKNDLARVDVSFRNYRPDRASDYRSDT
ncbi:hypothetical protein ABZ460_42125 [Streptomyces fagopyri]